MPRDAMYLFVYDVTDDAERSRLSGVLEGYGLGVQKSAFECRLSRSALNRLLGRLEAMGMESGFLYLYKLGTEARRQGIGKCPEAPFAEERHAYVV